MAKADDYIFTITDRDSTGRGKGRDTARDRAIDTHRDARRKDPRGARNDGRDERGRFLPGSNAPATRPTAGNKPGRLRSAVTDALIGAGLGGAVVAEQIEAALAKRLGNLANGLSAEDMSELPYFIQSQRKDRARKERSRATRTANKAAAKSKYVGPLLSRAFGSNIMSIAKGTLTVGAIFEGVGALGEGLENAILRRQTEAGFDQSRMNLVYEAGRAAANSLGRRVRDYTSSGISNLAAFFQTGGQFAAGGNIRTIGQNAARTGMQFERQLFELQKKLSEWTGGFIAAPDDTAEMKWRKENNKLHEDIAAEVRLLGLSSERKIAVNTSLRLWEMGLDAHTLELVSRENRRRVAIAMAERVKDETTRRTKDLPRSYLEALEHGQVG